MIVSGRRVFAGFDVCPPLMIVTHIVSIARHEALCVHVSTCSAVAACVLSALPFFSEWLVREVVVVVVYDQRVTYCTCIWRQVAMSKARRACC